MQEYQQLILVVNVVPKTVDIQTKFEMKNKYSNNQRQARK